MVACVVMEASASRGIELTTYGWESYALPTQSPSGSLVTKSYFEVGIILKSSDANGDWTVVRVSRWCADIEESNEKTPRNFTYFWQPLCGYGVTGMYADKQAGLYYALRSDVLFISNQPLNKSGENYELIFHRSSADLFMYFRK